MAESKKRIIREASRHVTPAFTLSQVGKYALEKAQQTQEGSLLEITTALLMCPLVVEAVLNQVGTRLFLEDDEDPERWAEVEWYSPRDKVKAIAKRLGISIDLGRKPFNVFTAMFDFRIDLAHAKSMRLTVEGVEIETLEEYPDLSQIPGLQARWESHCNLATAERWRTATAEMAELLCKAADVANPLVGGYMTTWSSEAVDE